MYYRAKYRRRLRALARSACVASLMCGAFLASTARGDVLRILSGDQEAAQARVDLIQQARHEIDAAYFAVSDDELSLAFMALLRDAAQRGVKVRLVFDALRNKLPAMFQACLLDEGVEIRQYHPVLTQPLKINRRLHDKLLVVDGARMIVGSRNLNGQNFGQARRNYVDLDAYVSGAAAAQAYHYFQGLWSSDEVRPLGTGPRWTDIEDFAPRLTNGQRSAGPQDPHLAMNGAMCGLCARGLLRTDTCVDWSAGQPELYNIQFLCDDCGCKRRGAISQQIMECFARAQHSIVIESPYLVLSPALEATLVQARARGVCVVILTNSLASTDHVAVYGGYANQKQKLLACGMDLWEFAGPDRFHAKAAVIDGCVSIIGSSNLDPRSEHLNTETAIVVCDPTFAASLIDAMAAHFAGAWRIGPDGRPLDSTVSHPGASRSKRFQLGAARLIAPLIERHL
jgi:phosphatidylserine/phosphatidylglycerophosphate/cardiolipin synthase-like enzyme